MTDPSTVDSATSEPAATARDLILAHHSIRHAGFEERVAAAAGAGFDGIGLNFPVYRRMLDEGWTPERTQAVLDDAGIRLLEIEALRIFDTEGAGPVLDMVDTFQPLHVQVIAPFEGEVPLGPAGERFASLCERVAPAGTRLAFEFLPVHRGPRRGRRTGHHRSGRQPVERRAVRRLVARVPGDRPGPARRPATRARGGRAVRRRADGAGSSTTTCRTASTTARCPARASSTSSRSCGPSRPTCRSRSRSSTTTSTSWRPRSWLGGWPTPPVCSSRRPASDAPRPRVKGVRWLTT